MNNSSSLASFFSAALSKGAVGFSLGSGHPVLTYHLSGEEASSDSIASEEIEDFISGLMDSRQRRQFRDSGVAHLTVKFEGVDLLIGVKRDSDTLRAEVRRMAPQD